VVVGVSVAGEGSRSSDDGSSHAAHREDLDVSDVTFVRPDLSTFARLDGLGLEVVGQCLERDRAVLACRVAEPDEWCRRCGWQGSPRDRVTRRLAHELLGWRPTTLLVTVRRYRCTGCGHVWRQETSNAAPARVKLSRRGLRWALLATSPTSSDAASLPREAGYAERDVRAISEPALASTGDIVVSIMDETDWYLWRDRFYSVLHPNAHGASRHALGRDVARCRSGSVGFLAQFRRGCWSFDGSRPRIGEANVAEFRKHRLPRGGRPAEGADVSRTGTGGTGGGMTRTRIGNFQLVLDCTSLGLGWGDAASIIGRAHREARALHQDPRQGRAYRRMIRTN